MWQYTGYIELKINIKAEKEKDRCYFLNTGKIRPSIMNFFRQNDCNTTGETKCAM